MGCRGRGAFPEAVGKDGAHAAAHSLLMPPPSGPRTADSLFSGSEASCASQPCWTPTQEQSRAGEAMLRHVSHGHNPPRQAGVSSVDAGVFVRPQKGVLLCSGARPHSGQAGAAFRASAPPAL